MDGRPPSVVRVLKMLAGLTVLSVISGVLLAVVALPAVYAAGSSTQTAVDYFENMPSDFAISTPATQSRIVLADGKTVIANPYDENRIIVPLDKISPWMRKAQVAIEDSRFYEHGGLDLRSFSRAVASGLTGAQVQGGSTLTMQYVKLVLQESALRRGDKAAAAAATAPSAKRKLQELRYTLHVEQNYTKDQILAGYLNLAYYGDQAYGVEAAARNYFNIPASKLDIGQAALLAGIVQAPGANDPVNNPKAATIRRNVVLSRMVQLGLAPRAEADKYRKVPIQDMLKNRQKLGATCQRSTEPYVCEFVMAYIANNPRMTALGKTPDERLKNLKQGGYTVTTTIDPSLQRQSLAELRKAVHADNMKLGDASVTLEAGTGKIKAMVQWSDYKKTQIVYTADHKYNGVELGFQFGSTAKMFALVTALEAGFPLTMTVPSPNAPKSKPHVFMPRDSHDECGLSAPWPVRNDHTTPPFMSLASATAGSVNTAFASLVLQLGACKVRAVMTRMGMRDGSGDPMQPFVSEVTLGSGSVSPMTLAAAYNTLPSKGIHCEPTPIESITDYKGKKIDIGKPECTKVIEPGVAAGVTKLLRGVMTNGTGSGLWYTSHPNAGKTGTTSGNVQTWFVGYTAQLTTAVWVGNVNVRDPKTGRENTLNGKCFEDYGCFGGQVFGASIAGKIWGKIMRQAHENLPNVAFDNPPSMIAKGNYVDLPSVYGRSVANAEAILDAAGFKTFMAGQINSTLPAGLVVQTTPSGRAIEGTNIGLYVSTGYVPPPKATQPAVKPTSKVTATGGATPAPQPSPTKTKKKKN